MMNGLSALGRMERGVGALLLNELSGLLAAAMGQVVMAWWLAERGGAQDLIRYAAVMALTALVATPLLSPWGDRVCKRRLILWGRAALLAEALVMTGVAWLDRYDLRLLMLCGGLSTVAQAALLPAQVSLLPALVTRDALPQAIRQRRAAQAIGTLLGPGVAGLALSIGGVSGAWLVSVPLFVLGVGAAARLPRIHVPAAAAAPWRRDLVAGVRAKWGVRVDRWWTLTGALMMVFFLPATGVLLPLRLQSLGLPAGWLGACGAAMSLGLLAGVLGLADRLVARVDRARAIGGAVLVCGLCVGAVGGCDRPTALVALFGLMGLCLSVTQLIGQTHRALAVPEDFRFRMAAAQLTVAHLAASAAPLAAGLLLSRFTPGAVYLWMAGGFLLSGLGLLAVPELRGFLRLNHQQVAGWYGRRYPEAFRRGR